MPSRIGRLIGGLHPRTLWDLVATRVVVRGLGQSGFRDGETTVDPIR